MSDGEKKKDRFSLGKGKDKDGKNKEPNTLKGTGKSLIFWVALLLVIVVAFSYFDSFMDRDIAEIKYSEFITELKNENVTEVDFTNKEIEGVLRNPVKFVSTNTPDSYQRFRSRIPPGDDSWELVNRLEEAGVQIAAKGEDHYFSILISILPWVFLVLIWLFFLRQMQGGGGGGTRGLFSFGKSKAKLLTDERPKVTFNDVAGAEEAKEELQEIIEFLKTPGKFQKLGGKIPKGALLLGSPGTGKTLLARAVAGEASVPFFSMSGSDFVEMFVGVGASRVRDLFEQGKKNAPCIIFIDEIDAVGRHRGAGLGGGHDEREQTLNQLLVEMDGFESNEGVILVAATNRPDVLDPALLRPGRFDRQIVVAMPDVKGREGILKVHVRKIKLADDVDLSVLARGTPGMSGADLANLANEAALLAARKDLNAVDMETLEMAKDKVLMGSERRSLVITDPEKKTTAIHEAGHALVSRFVPEADPIHKVTIIPRGMALGLTQQLPTDELHCHNNVYLESTLTILLGGRVAEKLVFDLLSTGAASDLERATKLARKMVCNWGMSDKLGPVTLGKSEDHIFLGREMAQQKDYSEATAVLIDQEVRDFIERAEERARLVVTEHVDKLHKIAEALLEHETIDGQAIDEIIGMTEGDTEKNPQPAPSPEEP